MFLRNEGYCLSLAVFCVFLLFAFFICAIPFIAKAQDRSECWGPVGADRSISGFASPTRYLVTKSSYVRFGPRENIAIAGVSPNHQLPPFFWHQCKGSWGKVEVSNLAVGMRPEVKACTDIDSGCRDIIVGESGNDRVEYTKIHPCLQTVSSRVPAVFPFWDDIPRKYIRALAGLKFNAINKNKSGVAGQQLLVRDFRRIPSLLPSKKRKYRQQQSEGGYQEARETAWVPNGLGEITKNGAGETPKPLSEWYCVIPPYIWLVGCALCFLFGIGLTAVGAHVVGIPLILLGVFFGWLPYHLTTPCLPLLGTIITNPFRKRKPYAFPLKHGRFRERRISIMTTCIAAICGNNSAIILCADKALGLGHVQNVIGVKILSIHKSWRLMFAGGDTQPVFDIVDRTKELLRDRKGIAIAAPTTQQVKEAVTEAWRAELNFRVEKKILGRREGWTLKRLFDEGKNHFLESDLNRMIDKIEREQFDLEIIVAGFDSSGSPAVMSASGHSDGILNRDIGYSAIGNGAPNALTFLSWRETKPSTPLRGALAQVIEAKYWGEFADGNSEETDVFIMRSGREDITLSEDSVENILFEKIAIANTPRLIKRAQLELLNDLPELSGIPYVWADKKDNLTEMPFDPDAKPKREKPGWIKAKDAAAYIEKITNPPPPPEVLRRRKKSAVG